MRILGIIPARGGSKGIPRKNILPINGKPLIAYSIEKGLEAIKQDIITELIVSTDDQEIAEISASLGANVPFLRPESISGDKDKSVSFVLHAIDFFEKQSIRFDAVMLLQPTSPLRSLDDILRSVELFKNAKEDSLISVYQEDYINDLVMYKMGDDAQGTPLNRLHNKGVRRQDHGAVFVRNGSIYITTVNYLKATEQIISDFPILYEMDKSKSVNIDTLEDIELMKKML